MKQVVCWVMLIAGIAGESYGQIKSGATNENNTFELPANRIARRIQIDIGKGNTMQIELTDLADLDRLSNIDSLLWVFQRDIAFLKDSLTDELSSKRIDYIMDSSGDKKIRLRLTKSTASTFLIQQGEPAALKLEQDTINFVGTVATAGKKGPELRYYRLSLFMNRLSELPAYMDGRLNEKIKNLQKNIHGDWEEGKDGRWHPAKDYTISSGHARGLIFSRGDQLELGGGAGLQNYKNYFAPSFSVGATVRLSTASRQRETRRELGIYWEPHFFFGRNSQGNVQTSRNDFLSIAYRDWDLTSNKGKEPVVVAGFSLAYLIHREGDYVDKNSFRLGTGRLSFHNKIKVEPVLYFHDFLRGVTPGMRVLVTY